MANFEHNIILNTDSYKASHFLQYPQGSEALFSYVESRGGDYKETVFFGLQYIIKQILANPITKEMVEEADVFFKMHGEPFNKDAFMYIIEKYNGYLPLKIKAVKEGAVIPTHNVLVTIESTDEKALEIGSYFEPLFLRVWYPITVATQSFNIKKVIKAYLDETSDDPEGQIGFKLHDFGARGVSSAESSGIGGMSHLVNFMGSDTLMGVYFANKFYNIDMAGFSIPAAEQHSTITSYGRDGEVAAYRNMLKQFAKPGSLLGCSI